jgi:hypothetical protein
MGMPPFFVPFIFPCPSSHTFPLPAQGVYIFLYNSLDFRFLGETSIPHHIHLEKKRVSLVSKKKRLDPALATKLEPGRLLRSDGVFGSRGFLHEDIRLDYRYSL